MLAELEAKQRHVRNALLRISGDDGSVYIDGSLHQSSDARLKKNITSLTGALLKLIGLRGVNYEWKEPEKHGNLTQSQIGFISQEVEKIFPKWVSTDHRGPQNGQHKWDWRAHGGGNKGTKEYM